MSTEAAKALATTVSSEEAAERVGGTAAMSEVATPIARQRLSDHGVDSVTLVGAGRGR